MSGVSGIACILGSAIVCIDLLVQSCTRRKSFRIINNSEFLSASLCLSSGVLLYTSLYSMLPNSQTNLARAGFSPRAAAYTLIGLFLAGVLVISIVSGYIHNHIPSHVVDCTHTHMQESDPERGEVLAQNSANTERTPLLARSGSRVAKSTPAALQTRLDRQAEDDGGQQREEPVRLRLSRKLSLLMGNPKVACDDNGLCYGVSQTCGHECAKIAPNVTATVDNVTPFPPPDNHDDSRSDGGDSGHIHPPNAVSEGLWYDDPSLVRQRKHEVEHQRKLPHEQENQHGGSSSESSDVASIRPELSRHISDPVQDESHRHAVYKHHHHVPQNAFLSIGLQTSLAIALHKLPEGFITYATNHANPKLGMTVFLALFIHNITEGFAMALPLYLALHSRGRAILWSSLLGGVSQPAGAGIAALWIWASRKAGGGDSATGPSWGVYGGMFAATAGIMTFVALQLFIEGSGLTHHRNLCIGCAVAGMGLMGFSFALTA